MLLRNKLLLLSILLFPIFATAQFTKNKDSVLSILRRNTKDDSIKVIDYARVSQVYNQKPDSAIYYINEGLKLARKVDFQRGIALMNSKLGTFYLDDGRYKQADSVFRIALEVHRKLKRYEDQGTVYQALSAVYSEAGDEVNTLKYILIARQLYEKRGLREHLPFCNATIGIVYLNQGEVNNAVKYIKEGIRIAEDLKLNHKFSTEANAYYNLTVLADLCTNLAAIFSDKNDYRSALKYYDQSIKVSKEGGFYDSNVLLFVNAADVYRKTGDEKRARTLLDTALRLAQQGNLYREKYKIYTQLGMLESSPAKALPYFNKAVQLASKQLTDLMEIYDDKAQYFKEKGQYKESLEAFEKYEELKDSVRSVEKSKQIANLKSVNQLHQSELKVQTLSTENYKSKVRSTVITLISIFLLAVIVAGFFFYKKLQKLHLLTKTQKEDLEDLNDMKDRIFYIIGHDLRGPLASVTSITELMAMEFSEDPEISEYVSMLSTKQKQAIAILDKLLTWGKLEFQDAESNHLFNVLDSLKVSLDGIVSGAVEKEIDFTVDIPPTLALLSDANHFDFVIRNLLQNALKFTMAGGQILLSYIEDQKNQFHVFTIKDTGVGMTEEQLSTLMKLGLKTTTGTSNESGTGLGLMLVKKIADKNNHLIVVESSLNNGTTFYYKIPF